MIRTILIALQFLTRFPVRLTRGPSAEETGRSACAYPWIGLLLGVVAVIVYLPLRSVDPALLAVLLLVLSVVLSGGLHLDGLADTVDAWVGGHGDREATLRIMKDTALGAMGSIALVLLLLGKFVCLKILLGSNHWIAVGCVPVFGRMALLGLLLTTPYVRAAGLGSSLARHIPSHAGWTSLTAAGLLMLGALGMEGLVVLSITVLGVYMLRLSYLNRLGGTTGDTLGAACELIELLALATLAIGAGL